MAPVKSSRVAGDDHKPDSAGGTGSGSKEKGNAGNPTSAKMRRGASQTSASQLREAAAAAPTSAPSQKTAEAQIPTIHWSSFERDALHSYCREHKLNSPAAFVSTFHHIVMSRPGSIGLSSPTMIQKQQNRRQSKESLATAVRKHFNGVGIQENDVIVDFIYKVRSENSSRAGGPNRQPGIISDQ